LMDALAGRSADLAGQRLRFYREGSGAGLPILPVAPGQTVDWDGARFSVVAQGDAQPGAIVRALGMQGWVDAKKLVPGLDSVGLPAAAVATLPVVAEGATGEVISYCGLDALFRQLVEEGGRAGAGNPIPGGVLRAWLDNSGDPRDRGSYFACYNLFSQHW